MSKPKIINIMPHGPAYHFSPDEKPDILWNKADGSWLGFWAREWPDVLGEAVLKETDKYEWEVWQPDYRADRIYSKVLENGVTHRLFPAEERIYRIGIKPRKGVFSEMMISSLKKHQNDPIILKLHSSYGLRVPFYIEILKIFGATKKFPIFFVGHGMFNTPLSELLCLHRPLTYVCLMVEHLRLKKLIKYIDVISEQAESALREARSVYSGRIEKLTMGCDFHFWVPVPSKELKETIRNKLNIPQEKMVFLASGNFIPRKQFDKLLEVFKDIQKRDDFFVIIVGHGDEAHTKILMSLAATLIKQKKAILHPYVRGVELRNLYWASDLYISVSTDEGCSVTVLEALASGLPVLSTEVGETAEIMKKHGVGKLIPINDYDEWEASLKYILDNGLPKTLDMQIAREAYHREYIARRLVNIYHDLCKSYFFNS
jgi:glycosyltransferase involved in cell wall biosynthesis